MDRQDRKLALAQMAMAVIDGKSPEEFDRFLGHVTDEEKFQAAIPPAKIRAALDAIYSATKWTPEMTDFAAYEEGLRAAIKLRQWGHGRLLSDEEE